jgi:hypothetical protein
MGLTSAPLASQWLFELVVKGMNNVIIYTDNLSIHSQTHKEHLWVLDAVFTLLA